MLSTVSTTHKRLARGVRRVLSAPAGWSSILIYARAKLLQVASVGEATIARPYDGSSLLSQPSSRGIENREYQPPSTA